MSIVTNQGLQGHCLRERFLNRATLTVDETADLLGISRNSSYEYVRRG